MSQFSRRAKWLNQLFPPSVAPVVSDPSSRSDDVSLVQQYDGGALSFAEATFPADPSPLGTALAIGEPEIGIRDFLSVIGIVTSTDMIVLPTGLYARIFGVTVLLFAGLVPEHGFLDLRPPTGSGVGDHIALLTQDSGNFGNFRKAQLLNQDIIPPGHQVNWQQINGDAATQMRITISWCVAPVGAIIISSNGNGES